MQAELDVSSPLKYLRHGKFILAFGLVLAVGRVAPVLAEDETHDPLESTNRAVFDFNMRMDRYLLKPVARTYANVMPGLVRTGISNFFSNLLGPTVILNDLLQGKVRQSAGDGARFLINSTLGLAGMLDVASRFDLRAHEEDFGQTLAVWGAGEGPYLVLPILGPRTLRDGAGLGLDFYTQPMTHVGSDAGRWGAYSGSVVDTRSRLLSTTDVLDQATTGDDYLFVREAYRQRRFNLVHDGDPPPVLFLDDPEAISQPVN